MILRKEAIGGQLAPGKIPEVQVRTKDGKLTTIRIRLTHGVRRRDAGFQEAAIGSDEKFVTPDTSHNWFGNPQLRGLTGQTERQGCSSLPESRVRDSDRDGDRPLGSIAIPTRGFHQRYTGGGGLWQQTSRSAISLIYSPLALEEVQRRPVMMRLTREDGNFHCRARPSMTGRM